MTFFQKMQEHPARKLLPFFFMSAIPDKKVIHASYRLGVSYFFVKPIDIQTLLSLIEGKLRIS